MHFYQTDAGKIVILHEERNIKGHAVYKKDGTAKWIKPMKDLNSHP